MLLSTDRRETVYDRKSRIRVQDSFPMVLLAIRIMPKKSPHSMLYCTEGRPKKQPRAVAIERVMPSFSGRHLAILGKPRQYIPSYDWSGATITGREYEPQQHMFPQE